MKFTKAIFKNFRLLRDLELDFSSDTDKRLTVFRAENESGKTTTLVALQWALFGDVALPAKGKEYRLHPIDWDYKSSNRVPIEVMIEFEHTDQVLNPDGNFHEFTKRYRLFRTTTEELNGNKFVKRPSTLSLYELTPKGDEPIEHPEPLLQDMLPLELREVFFTDGDRALSFIEADVSTSTKRQRVQNAIKSLLGLGIIENAIQHVRYASAEVNRKVKNASHSGELSRVSQRLDEINEELGELLPQLENLTEQLSNVELKLDDTEKEILAVLSRGDEEQLRKDIEECASNIKKLQDISARLERQHSDLLKDETLALDLIAPFVKKATDSLSSLKEQGTIPSNTIPVLQDRLEVGVCFCGESLSEDKSNGIQRRQNIEQLIEDQRRKDQILDQLTELYYGSRNYRIESLDDEHKWIEKYKSLFQQRKDINEQLEQARQRKRSLEVRLDELGDTDIKSLKDLKRHLKEQKDRLTRDHERTETRIRSLRNEERQLQQERDSLVRQQERDLRLISELEATHDIQRILDKTYEAILNDELSEVSDTMNEYFLKMIGSDPEQGAIIQKAEITREFDIKVYGPKRRHLDPDRDLNGASRRALTISFILALTHVSEVCAPNIIDTPLGMTSGHVKRSLLETAIEHSSQLVLFLTRSEIETCQDILDRHAGKVITLTNSAHFPNMLKNDPQVQDNKILRCSCDHLQVCKVCERLGDDSNTSLSFRSN